MFQHPRSQPRPEQFEHRPVDYPALYLRHQGVMIDRLKTAEMSASSTHQARRLTSALTTSRASIAERFGRNPKLDRQEVGLEDRLQDDLGGGHDDAVAARVGTMASYCLLARGPWGLGFADGLEVDRCGDALAAGGLGVALKLMSQRPPGPRRASTWWCSIQ